MGKIIALAAGKGGTGKTLLTAALGERLAARGEQVCLLDACAGLRGLDLSLYCRIRWSLTGWIYRVRTAPWSRRYCAAWGRACPA